MASHVQGIALTIKAFLPTGKTIDEQFETLSLMKDAHASGDYSKVLAVAKIDEVKAEQKTRRIEDAPAITEPATTEPQVGGSEPEEPYAEPTGYDRPEPDAGPSDEAVPTFLKKGKASAA